jgi:hypothetical protein
MVQEYTMYSYLHTDFGDAACSRMGAKVDHAAASPDFCLGLFFT